MIALAKKYPEYGFERHVGYGTAIHRQALLDHGVCPEHRRSFRPIYELIKQHEDNIILNPEIAHKAPTATDTATAHGQKAERAVIAYLQAHDHGIIAHNYKNKAYEIDIISTQDGTIYFTEVKYRQSSAHGSPIDQITPQKHRQMQFAAEAFISEHPEFLHYQPRLAAGTVSGKDYSVDGWLSLPE